IERIAEEELGVINVNVETELDYWFIELFQNNKLVSLQTDFVQSEVVSFANLKPGNYELSVVKDENKNDRWDAFNPEDYSGPEKRFIYNKTIKVKANWEHEVDFEIIE
ncbi:MAG: DUF2141 domain-containing protein, partial [Crocinitomicaceae bacterium]|nr:DUF2141 domain-containing protein [Crocinitomicaceae bacterium]